MVAELINKESLPAGERGLKLACPLVTAYAVLVAPRRGAWIEIFDGYFICVSVLKSLPAGERGLKCLRYIKAKLQRRVNGKPCVLPKKNNRPKGG